VIKRGQAVQFVNQSETGKNLWVASDPYPTNSNYPAFNAGKAVGKGGTYTFIFTKTGTWTYHNDLNPSRRASVIVNYE
jgi:plastocyanin